MDTLTLRIDWYLENVRPHGLPASSVRAEGQGGADWDVRHNSTPVGHSWLACNVLFWPYTP